MRLCQIYLHLFSDVLTMFEIFTHYACMYLALLKRPCGSFKVRVWADHASVWSQCDHGPRRVYQRRVIDLPSQSESLFTGLPGTEPGWNLQFKALEALSEPECPSASIHLTKPHPVFFIFRKQDPGTYSSLRWCLNHKKMLPPRPSQC